MKSISMSLWLVVAVASLLVMALILGGRGAVGRFCRWHAGQRSQRHDALRCTDAPVQLFLRYGDDQNRQS